MDKSLKALIVDDDVRKASCRSMLKSICTM